jgi:hypothetical protein
MPSELARLDRLLAGQEQRVKDAFAIFLRDVRSDYTVQALADLIEAGQTDEALAVIDSYVVRLGNVIPAAFQDVAEAEIIALADEIAPNARVAISFDPTNYEAATLMRQSRLAFIVAFTEAQREATRQALARAFEQGQGTVAAARAFRDSIGLTATQEAAVANFQRLLDQQSADALGRALRDRRFDRTVTRSLVNEEPLTRAQIDRMVARYRENMLTLRAQTIARTEMQRTVNEARREAFRQTMEVAGIDPSTVERVWRATHDERTRDSHMEMDEQKVTGFYTPFVSGLGNPLMYPGDPSGPPEDVINCRCVVVHRIP